MKRLQYRTKVDLGVACATVVIGLFFAYQVSLIETYSDNVVGPKFFPFALAIITTGIGVLIGVTAILSDAAREADTPDGQDDTGEKFGFGDADLRRVFMVALVGLIYVGLFYAFGYLLGTALALCLMLLAFGNRGWILLTATSIGGALFYNYVFLGLLGVYNPPGKYVDLERFLAGLF